MSKPTKPPKFRDTQTARHARERLRGLLYGVNTEMEMWQAVQYHVPEAWTTLAEDLPFAEKKVKVTLLLDESVIKMFRATGPGYQARVNRVLATWVQMQIGHVEKERQSMKDMIEEHGYPMEEETREQLLNLLKYDFIEGQLEDDLRTMLGVWE